MSAQITAKIEIRDMRILKDTLEKMGYKFTETGNEISINTGYRGIRFCGDKVTYDSGQGQTVNEIKCQYALNFKKQELANLGLPFEVVETEKQIEISVLA
jgi:hypothetical protein